MTGFAYQGQTKSDMRKRTVVVKKHIEDAWRRLEAEGKEVTQDALVEGLPEHLMFDARSMCAYMGVVKK